jgi:hypothetical protein
MWISESSTVYAFAGVSATGFARKTKLIEPVWSGLCLMLFRVGEVKPKTPEKESVMRFATIALLSAALMSPIMVGCTESHQESTSTNPLTGTKTTKDQTTTNNPMTGDSSTNTKTTSDNPMTGSHSESQSNK